MRDEPNVRLRCRNARSSDTTKGLIPPGELVFRRSSWACGKICGVFLPLEVSILQVTVPLESGGPGFRSVGPAP